MRNRIEALRNLFPSKKLDGYIAIDEKNMHYLTGFLGGSVLLIPQEQESVLFVYGVNFEAAKLQTQNARVELVRTGEDSVKKIAEKINGLKLRRVGFDSLKASTHLNTKELLKETELESAEDMVWTLRKVKDENELACMKRAAELTSFGMKEASETVRAGLTEREVAAEIEYVMRKSGSDGVAFDTLLSSGPNSAFPHGGCGDRIIKEGDLVVVDIGAKFQGYCNDLTRTFIVGKPSLKQSRIYEAVAKAQNTALKKIRAGCEGKEVDRVAREQIEKAGYGEYFVHGLGHGVGLDIHEPPTLGPASKDILASGNVVTVEPGIYLPGFGGVRIEDTVLVLDEEAKKLIEAPIFSSV